MKISEKLYSKLANLAEGFDTPENVIEKLVNNYGSTHTHVGEYGKRDTTKYLFNGNKYGKGKLVLAVIQQYYEDNSNSSIEDLRKVFPDHTPGNKGIFVTYDEARDVYLRTDYKRHFIDDLDLFNISGIYIMLSATSGAKKTLMTLFP